MKNYKFALLHNLSIIVIFVILFLPLSLSFIIGTPHITYGASKQVALKESKQEQRDLPPKSFTTKLKKRNPSLTVSAESVLQKLKEKQDIMSFAQRCDFTSSVEGWIARNTNTNIRWSPDGYRRLYMDTYGSDPQLFNKDVYLDLLRR